nr:hypothetical protein [Streptomyces sp. A1547]
MHASGATTCSTSRVSVQEVGLPVGALDAYADLAGGVIGTGAQLGDEQRGEHHQLGAQLAAVAPLPAADGGVGSGGENGVAQAQGVAAGKGAVGARHDAGPQLFDAAFRSPRSASASPRSRACPAKPYVV